MLILAHKQLAAIIRAFTPAITPPARYDAHRIQRGNGIQVVRPLQENGLVNI